MTDLIEQARTTATRAHQGQVDKTGAPYIGHPARVASRVGTYAAAGDSSNAQAVAWLHDVVEDTPMTLEQLAEIFPPEIVVAVDAITKRTGEADDDYYARVGADRLALAVKHADLDDNTDAVRTAALDPATRERLAAKYAHARAALSAG